MKKLLNKKGFTLMEMMIVVAIIVILVAISIPTFSGSLDSANKATDAANLRAAKAAYVTQDMNNEIVSTKTYYYNFGEGKFVEGDADDATAAESVGSCTNHDGDYITISSGKVVWSDASYEDDCE